MKIEKPTSQLEAKVPVEVPQDDEANERIFNVREVCQGIKVWQNPVNKFTVARVHYSCDPRKRDTEWKAQARAGITWSEWMREYEIVWSSFDGIPVYGDDFARAFHVSEEPLKWASGYPMVRGWDFGLGAGGMACIWAQLLSYSRLFIYKELVAGDTDIEHFIPEVQRLSNEWFPGCVKWFDVVDPSGFNRNQIDKRSCASVMRDPKFRMEPMPGAKGKVERRRSVTSFLQGAVKGLPTLLTDREGVPTLIYGFEGGYHYSYAKDGQLKEDPDKNEYSHPHDALQMICSRVRTLDWVGDKRVEIAYPRYGFGNQVARVGL